MSNEYTKIIHYCWFGGKPLSKLTEKCIESWKRFLPEFEIKEWNENNFDVNQCPFVKGAYETKKWAYVADYTRFKVLQQYGGLYLDTDMEITADISKYLELDFFMGKEDSNMTNAAVAWCKEKENKHIKEIIDIYESKEVFNPNNDLYEISVPRILTEYFEGYGFKRELDEIQILDNGTINIYPMEYFYPLSYDYQNNKFTQNSCMIHHFDATWVSKSEKFKVMLKRKKLGFAVKGVDILASIFRIIKDILGNKMLYFFLLIAILFFGIYSKLEYATDTYAIYSTNFKIPFDHFISCGRFITAGFWYVISILTLSITKSYLISFCIGIISITLSMYYLYKIIHKELNNKVISSILSILVIINAFIIELFMFFEKGILAFSILLCILALNCLIKFFEGHKKHIIYSLIFMILANFAYQGTVALFVSIALIFILKYSKNIKEFIYYNIVVVLIYGISASINYAFVKFVFHNTRTEDTGSNIVLSIKKIIQSLDNTLINSYDILPKYLFVSVLGIALLIIFINIITSHKGYKTSLYNIFGVIYIIVGVFCVTIAPYLMLGTEHIWLVPRSTYAIASLLGILLMFLFFNFKVNKKLRMFIMAGTILYILIQFVGFQRISIDHYILNYNDKIISFQIADRISEYELDSEKKITKIAIYKDENSRYSYKDLIVNGDMNVTAFAPDWSVIGLIYVYTGKQFKKIDSSEQIYLQYFKENNWKYYNDDQLVFENDTLHLYIF